LQGKDSLLRHDIEAVRVSRRQRNSADEVRNLLHRGRVDHYAARDNVCAIGQYHRGPISPRVNRGYGEHRWIPRLSQVELFHQAGAGVDHVDIVSVGTYGRVRTWIPARATDSVSRAGIRHDHIHQVGIGTDSALARNGSDQQVSWPYFYKGEN